MILFHKNILPIVVILLLSSALIDSHQSADGLTTQHPSFHMLSQKTASSRILAELRDDGDDTDDTDDTEEGIFATVADSIEEVVSSIDDDDDTDEDSEDEEDDTEDSDADEECDEDTTIVFEDYTLELEYTLTDDDIALIGDWFESLDTDADYQISEDEFIAAMELMGYNEAYATMCFQMVDGLDGHQNCDGVLKVFEVDFLYQISQGSSLMQSLFAFKAFDTDINGQLTEDDWDLVEAALSEYYNTDFDSVDTDGDGVVSVEEWQVMTGNCSTTEDE